jgi:hypothetical protein
MARTIQSPGVEIKEVDLSLRPNLPVGTTVFIPGFANQGPTDELLTVSSLSEFEQIYGLPQNAAERYMYHSVKAVFQSPANVLVSRLPYGQGAGATVADKYSVQVYPVIPRPIIVDGAAPEINTIEKDERIIAWHPRSAEETTLTTTASYIDTERNIDIVSNIPGGDGNVFKTQAPKNSTQLTIEELFTGENVTINSGGNKKPPPSTIIAVDGGEYGDFIVAQPATSQFKTTVDVITVDTGADKNSWTIVINPAATDNNNSFDSVAGVFTINSSSTRLTGKDITNRINQNFSSQLSANGGLEDIPAIAATVTDQGATVTADVPGADGNVPLTAAPGSQATVTGQGATVTADNVGVAGDVTLTADGTDVDALVTAHNAQFANNTLTVVSGGGVIPTSNLVLTGGVDGTDVDALVSAHNTNAIASKQLTVVSGGDVIPANNLVLAGGADLVEATDSLRAIDTLTFSGGLSTGLSTKVIPAGEWKFGEENPGGYVGTTLKDAVDSVLAASETLSGLSQNDLYWTEATPGDPLSIPALEAYEIPELADLVAQAVNSAGWDLSASDRYYLGEPSNIELTNDEFQKTIKGEIKLSQANAGKKENQKFTTYNDLLVKGGAGMMIVNDKKFVLNEKFEGYYIGISDNTNMNPATDFDSVGQLKSLSKKLGGTTGGYVNVPDTGTKSRLTFSLSAGFIFDQYGNKQQVGLDGSMSEALENLSEFDLNTDEYSDVLTLAVFKVRQSTLEPDATKLDYLVADSVIGSVNYFREAFKSTGGTATSYFIESEAANSNNLYLKFNEGISKDAGNWLDENGFPTRKIRVLPSKSVSYYDELTTSQQSGTTQEVNDFKVSQAFLNGTEEREDRLYIKSWQGLQATGDAQIKHGNNVYPHGVYRKQSAAAKETGNIPAKLDRIFELADNFDLFPIDITIESGLGTVYVGTNGGTVESFDDEEFFNIGDHVVSSTGLSGSGLYTTKLIDNRSEINYLTQYDTIFDTFKSFSQFARKDNIFIADPLRYIFVQGRNSKTLTSQQREAGVNFSQHIYWPLRHMMTGGTKNSSYCCTYANWGFTNDKALNRGVWVPMSGFAAAAMGNTDSNFYPWIAPAGFTRGLVSGIQDLAFYPKQKERDQLYKIGLNPVANFPNEGFAIFGQKTMQAKPSAFDRINVRRLFLYLQKATMNTVKYFVFEPNTLFTRTQVLNVLRPIFEEVKNTQGMFDYLLVCDERNNSPDVIDRNELVIDIYIKPTRAAEFILVNFYATRTGQDFSELVS